jgi:hypothetical protein
MNKLLLLMALLFIIPACTRTERDMTGFELRDVYRCRDRRVRTGGFMVNGAFISRFRTVNECSYELEWVPVEESEKENE